MAPGAAGGTDMVTGRVPAPLVPQLLLAVTLIVPPLVPKFTVIEFVPCPETMVAPAGTVQV